MSSYSPQQIRLDLQGMAEDRYRAFAAGLIPGRVRLLGVRLPALRTMAKQLARKGVWQLHTPADAYMEEVMLRGMIIGYARHRPLQARLAELEQLVPLITNWSICDTCCTTYSFVRQHRDAVWEWLAPYWESDQEFPARFGVVMLLCHYKQEIAWARRVAAVLPRVVAQGYYAEMAVAWCACELCLLYPAMAEDLLADLRPSVRQLTLRKLRESNRKFGAAAGVPGSARRGGVGAAAV